MFMSWLRFFFFFMKFVIEIKTGDFSLFLHICENKSADQLRGNRAAVQRLCFRYIDSTIPLHPKSEIYRDTDRHRRCLGVAFMISRVNTMVTWLVY